MASRALLEIARNRVPDADLRWGDMQHLPYDDDCFDLVTGFNSFFFAEDMVAALREAGRVARPGAPVMIQVFGRPERCDLEAVKAVMRPFLPARPAVRRRRPSCGTQGCWRRWSPRPA
jgi:ubiquinone/menaquinone biosynthesis C-methylase UbiE